MKKLFLLSILLKVSPIFAGQLDCEKAFLNDDLISCSMIDRRAAEKVLGDEIDSLLKSENGKLIEKLDLRGHYSRQVKKIIQICDGLYPDGRLRVMYSNYCVASQMQILSRGVKQLRCDQMTNEECR